MLQKTSTVRIDLEDIFRMLEDISRMLRNIDRFNFLEQTPSIDAEQIAYEGSCVTFLSNFRLERTLLMNLDRYIWHS